MLALIGREIQTQSAPSWTEISIAHRHQRKYNFDYVQRSFWSTPSKNNVVAITSSAIIIIIIISRALILYSNSCLYLHTCLYLYLSYFLYLFWQTHMSFHCICHHLGVKFDHVVRRSIVNLCMKRAEFTRQVIVLVVILASVVSSCIVTCVVVHFLSGLGCWQRRAA